MFGVGGHLAAAGCYDTKDGELFIWNQNDDPVGRLLEREDEDFVQNRIPTYISQSDPTIAPPLELDVEPPSHSVLHR